MQETKGVLLRDNYNYGCIQSDYLKGPTLICKFRIYFYKRKSANILIRTHPLNPRRLLIGDAVVAAEFSADMVRSVIKIKEIN